MDLHVTDPAGEKCYYSHPRTQAGAVLSRDVTGGLGPEIFIAPEALRGVYAVEVEYFASYQDRVSSQTQVYATVIRRWGTPEATVVRKVVSLPFGKSKADIDRLKVE